MFDWENRWTWTLIKQDNDIRDTFLHEARAFIRHVASQTCFRSLEWGRDEELSEALIIFNEAINRYEPDKGVPFPAFARLLIKRRLIDYHRRQSKLESASLDHEELGLFVENTLSTLTFQKELQNIERAEEIREYSVELDKWGLSFRDLVKVSPKHRDSRMTLLRAARYLAESPVLWNQTKQTGKVPMTVLNNELGIHPKVLERGRKYILAVAILIANQNDYIYLREYVLPQGGEHQ